MNSRCNIFKLGGYAALLASAITPGLSGCSKLSSEYGAGAPLPETTYEAKIERTAGGIPHITASDFGSLGFGTGYAAAEDNFCALARNILLYRAQLAQYFGADADQDGTPENLNSDFFYQMMIERGYYDHDVAPEMAAQFGGFAAGFNRYLLDTGIGNLPDPACRGADWIQQMTQEDVTRFHLKPVFLPNLASLIIPAQPPAGSVSGNNPKPLDTASNELLASATSPKIDRHAPGQSQSTAPLWSESKQLEIAALVDHLVKPFDRGSNGVAIGRELSTSGKGLLYTNPHLDWGIEFRMYPRHHIIPGVLNELGANTFERANVGFGTNGDIAWTNTVSTSTALTFYKLDLVPGDPMSYLFDGEVRHIEALPVTVMVKNTQGTLEPKSHSFYFSHFGPMAGGQFPWLTTLAFTMRIAEEGPRGMQHGAIDLATSKSVRDVKAALNRSQYTSSTNTIAVDTSGEVLYGDLGPVANFTDQQLTDCVFAAPTYKGNTSACEWNTDADSAASGLLGASKQAYLFRTDYVTNSNDTYWLTNPAAPLTGIPMVQGGIESERTLRTRSGLQMVAQRIDGSDGLGGNTFDLNSLLQRMLSNENYAGQILRDDLLVLCNANPSITLDAGSAQERTVDISGACSALADWDLHSNLESTGSHLFREFLRAAHGLDASNSDRNKTRRLPTLFNYTVAFDAGDPVNTPRGLNTGNNPVALQSLALAVEKLSAAGVALNARLGDIQTVSHGGDVIPWHGGEEFEGVFNKMSLDFDAAAGGYPAITGSGASWIMVTEFTDDGPLSKGILVYSLSTNTSSPHYADMTHLFSNKQFVDLPYHPDDVSAVALSSIHVSEGASSCQNGRWQDFTGEDFASESACIEFFRQINANRVTEYVTQ